MTTICLSGGIAVGKTTIVERMRTLLPSATIVDEHPENCLFLDDFYEDKSRWAFHSRMGMLALFSERDDSIDNVTAIIDRTIHELIVFARVQRKYGTLSEREYFLYQRIYLEIVKNRRSPDRIVLLETDPSECIRRVKRRARGFERNIDVDYIEAVAAEYRLWISEIDTYVDVVKVDNTEPMSDEELLGLFC